MYITFSSSDISDDIKGTYIAPWTSIDVTKVFHVLYS